MTAPRILPQDVASIRDLESLFQLLHDKLDWPVARSAIADEADTFQWTPEELRLSEDSARRLRDGGIRQVRYTARNQPWGVFLVEFRNGHVYRTALRQVLRGLVPQKRGRSPNLPAWQHENLLFICTTSECDRFTFGHFRGKRHERAKLATFGWERDDQYVRTLCTENLPRLSWPEDDGQDQDAWLKAWASAFDKEPLTKEFFKRFDGALDLIRADLQKFQGMKSADAYSRAQLLLERLIFLYFLQKRGWLSQDADYLFGNFRGHAGRPEEFSYYGDFLERLFYSLATPATGGAYRLPGVPFLNGGLFDDDEFAPTPVRLRSSPPLMIRNAVFGQVFEGLLEAFNFTVTEDTPLDTDVAVDPEMLGKVFESIVLHAEAADPTATAPDKRKATGSYYTPRIVVHFICREALRQYLITHLPGDGWGERLKKVMDLDPSQGFSEDDLERLRELLTPAQGSQLADALKGLTCCDPAVGSGAFPVGLMHELVNLRRIAEAAANGYVDPVRKEGTAWIHQTKEGIVENGLYGVDIQQQAIEICRLRLWLTLVVDYDLGLDPFTADKVQFSQKIQQISQLPNLEMNFRRGDSLHDHISGIPILLEPGALGGHRKDFEKIWELGAELHRAKRAETKRKRRVEIMRRRLDVSERVLTTELDRVRTHQGDLPGLEAIRAGAEKERRIGDAMARVQEAVRKIRSDRKELEELARQLEATVIRPDFYPKLRRLEGADFDSPMNFAWRLDFPGIFGKDEPGFDIIVGNPPFVTARDPEKRELWRKRWPQVCHGHYHMLCPFIALSFGLLEEGGELGFIVSNAFATREFGKPLVEDFLPTVDLQKIVDCSGLMFPGHGTPTCLLFGRNGDPDPLVPVRIAGILPGGGDLRTPPEESPLWQAIEKAHDNPGYEDLRIAVEDRAREKLSEAPVILDPTAAATHEQVNSAGVCKLVDTLRGNIGYVCVTRADDVYFVPMHLLRRCDPEGNHVMPATVGDEVRNWGLTSQEWALWPYDRGFRPLSLAENSRVRAYLSGFRDYLQQRTAYGRTQLESGREWYEYSMLFADRLRDMPVACYCDVSTHNHYCLVSHVRAFKDTAPVFKPATAGAPELVVALLNSSAALFWLKQGCFNKGAGEDEHRDRYEFLARKVEQLPVPDVIAQALSGAAKEREVKERNEAGGSQTCT